VAAAPLADRQGLTAAGGVVAASVVGLAGVAIDSLISRGLGVVFAVFFVLGCGLAALAVHRRDLPAMVRMPPLLYVELIVVEGSIAGSGEGSWLTRQALNVVTALTGGFPILLAAMALVLLLVALRKRD